jgi:hypothetical protein
MTATRFAVGAAVAVIVIAVAVVVILLWAEAIHDDDCVGFDTDDQGGDEPGETDGWSEVDEAALNDLLMRGHGP